MQAQSRTRSWMWILLFFPGLSGCQVDQAMQSLQQLSQGLQAISQMVGGSLNSPMNPSALAGLGNGAMPPLTGIGTGATAMPPLTGLGNLAGATGVPNLGLPGQTSAAPQTPVIPAGLTGNALVQQIQSQYGIQLTGTGLDDATVQSIGQALAYYQPQHLQRMGSINVIQHGRPFAGAEVAGLWQGSPGSGGDITLYSWTDHRPTLHTIVHECAHHFTIGANPQFGSEFLNRLETESPNSNKPTGYAQAGESELQAENLAVMLIGPQQLNEPIQPSYNPSPNAKAMVQQNFGRLAI